MAAEHVETRAAQGAAARAREEQAREERATAEVEARWQALRAPFPLDYVALLPKQVRWDDQDKGKCVEGSRFSADQPAPVFCGGWHARSVHLSYVGHADVTERLNEVDHLWTWEPMALTPHGTPLFSDGGLWIRLTILGVTRLGFGDAQGKSGANATKEIIGDAIRNASMRFGVATYLWSRSDRAKATALQHGGDVDESAPTHPQPQGGPETPMQAVRRNNSERPVQNVGRLHIAMQPLNAGEQETIRAHARAQNFPAPHEMTDAQTDDLVELAALLVQERTPGDPGPQDPP